MHSGNQKVVLEVQCTFEITDISFKLKEEFTETTANDRHSVSGRKKWQRGYYVLFCSLKPGICSRVVDKGGFHVKIKAVAWPDAF